MNTIEININKISLNLNLTFSSSRICEPKTPFKLEHGLHLGHKDTIKIKYDLYLNKYKQILFVLEPEFVEV